ncbi:TIGR03862 family flavoprotein [Rhodoblastus acidophilus]|uniref:TIGR03862 family flavoprotein n=1 Tax=Rhodoblastus acidophilus TaxID=1074 RepID=A0A6N8DNI6_RHOAC|nr:TIGR03862 family flavoprotein [Rhodoblastus acidophilus]MCW2274177.1 putative flavoprotein (TIGR03862 family) [Rhodoblastus acidophilus]MTV30741.1 TIGR03862 family flavoprotein [Rhodoblastus acidophilus]
MRKAFVIGAGPAGLSAAEGLARAGIKTHVFERMASPARKFLMAGRGGLNLTHSEDFERFLARYGDARERLAPFLRDFGPEQLRDWCAELGQETFVGSSGRVFPKNFKASPLLRAWLRRLSTLGVEFHLRHRLEGFENGQARFQDPDGVKTVEADAFVLALGGASWPRLGSDGSWVEPLKEIGLTSTPLRPANCGFVVAWSQPMIEKCAGHPLKNIGLSVNGRRARGECVITRGGLEGGVVYACSHEVGELLRAEKSPDIRIDLRPDVTVESLAARLARPRGKNSFSNFLRKAAHLDAAAVALLREGGPFPGEPGALAALIKSVPLAVCGVAGLERAISTAGGVIWDDLDENLMSKAFPGLFVAGEMLDWTAPTGGYLLTACFATGRAAGEAAARWLKRRG